MVSNTCGETQNRQEWNNSIDISKLPFLHVVKTDSFSLLTFILSQDFYYFIHYGHSRIVLLDKFFHQWWTSIPIYCGHICNSRSQNISPISMIPFFRHHFGLWSSQMVPLTVSTCCNCYTPTLRIWPDFFFYVLQRYTRIGSMKHLWFECIEIALNSLVLINKWASILIRSQS